MDKPLHADVYKCVQVFPACNMCKREFSYRLRKDVPQSCFNFCALCTWLILAQHLGKGGGKRKKSTKKGIIRKHTWFSQIIRKLTVIYHGIDTSRQQDPRADLADKTQVPGFAGWEADDLVWQLFCSLAVPINSNSCWQQTMMAKK